MDDEQSSISKARIGQTLSTAKPNGVDKGLSYIKSIGGRAIQYFISPPQNQYVVPLCDDDVDRFNSLRLTQYQDVYVVVHGKYIINFCHPLESAKGTNMRGMLCKELVQASRIGCNVIIHQGKNVDQLPREQAIQNYVDNIVQCLKETGKMGVNNKIVLENSAHQGTEIGYSITELADIWNLIPSKYKQRISFCLDTCHTFASGTYDLRRKSGVKKMFKDFDKLIGLEHLEVVHFNDSIKGLGCCVDKHADILCGSIGNKKSGGSTRGMRYLVKLCSKHNVPMILETTAKCLPMKQQIELLNDWANKSRKCERSIRKSLA